MAFDIREPLAIDQSLTNQLKAKGRGRRKRLAKRAETAGMSRSLRNDPLPPLQSIVIPLDQLGIQSRKLRKRDLAHVQEVGRSIAALGFCVPLLIGKDNLIIDGEVRYEAAKLLGLPAVPCIRIDHLSDTELRLLRVAVGRLGEKGQWDLEELKIELQELILADAPIEISGFSVSEVDQIIIGDAAEGIEEGPLAPEGDALAVARLGDMFQLGPHLRRLDKCQGSEPTDVRSGAGLSRSDGPAV
jgi:ParB-like nuclease domain